MNNIKTELAVIGAGPGGYTAAFRAADLGIKVTLINKSSKLGGVCLNKGCIPSKALLHLAKIINDTKEAKNAGIKFSKPTFNIEEIHKWKNDTITNLSSGITKLAIARNVNIINGLASFNSANQLLIKDNQDKMIELKFDNCIISTGSSPQIIPNLNKQHPNIISSTKALNFTEIPDSLLSKPEIFLSS